MFANLLPGLREIRAPLVSGYVWLAFFFVVLHPDLPTRADAGPTLRPLFDLVDKLSAVGLATVTGVAAYLIGSSVQELWKVLGRLVSPRRPLYGEVGVRTSAAGRRDIRDAVRICVQGVNNDLFQVALAPGEKGIPEAPTPAIVERELPLVRTLLLGERPELVGELDRLQAEADLRVTVAFPVTFAAVFLAFDVTWGWIFLLLPAGLLLLQGVQRGQEAGDLLAKALRLGKATAPALESLTTGAQAVLQRMDLEGELRRDVDSGDPMAAFRLGNLQASWDDLEAAKVSFEFAVEKGIGRAYAELGLVYERRGDEPAAERAFRNGESMGDGKSRRLLAEFLSRRDREEEALDAEKRARRSSLALQDTVPIGGDGEGSPSARETGEREADYRRRMAAGNPKAAINLGLLLRRQGEYEEAVDVFRSVTKLDPDDSQGWKELGRTHAQIGKYSDARAAFQEVLRIEGASNESSSVVVNEARRELASALYRLGDFDAAENLLKEALQSAEGQPGDTGPVVLPALIELGNVNGDAGRHAEAIGLYEQAIAMAEEIYGPREYVVAWILSNLGLELTEVGRLVEGIATQERALDILGEQLPDDDPRIAVTLENLAAGLRRTGELERSEALLDRALGLAARAEPPFPMDTVGRMNYEMAATLAASRKYEEALVPSRRAVELLEGSVSGNHPHLLRSLRLLAAILSDLGDDESERVRQRLSELGDDRD